ncbi:BLUF domain-containing protein [Acinetobacter piscicola]|uniref:BLUF domain-containing protein n=1 Tax=Acinetobacter piscicola TaxID=2006115 RepID=UPI000B7E49B2|nr:BLUF domain-containing protein [Acinetobacter piscicola]
MIQLCYASRTSSSEHEILNDLREILNEARNFNTKHDIHGVLYFADQYFFQCLEGEDASIKFLFEKLIGDPRHHQIKRFKTTAVVDGGHFSQWSMKYVRCNSQIQQYFNAKGYDSFQPLDLKDDEVPELLALLYEIEQVEL